MNNLSEKGVFISKSEAGMLQAVAVMLMVWHHLFGFPDRIAVPYVLVFDWFVHIETFMADFGKICVAVFAFVSGYGMRKKIVNSDKKTGLFGNYQSIGLQLLNFFKRYWAVFFTFIPLGLLLKVYPVDWHRFCKGIIGQGAGYNGEWWYVSYYVSFLLVFPIMTLLTDIILEYVPILMHILMVSIVVVVFFLPDVVWRGGYISLLLCSAEGMYFVDSGIFETLYRCLAKKAWLAPLTGIVLFVTVFILRFKGLPDYLLVAAFVFSVVLICKTEFIMRWLRPVLMFVGKYSTYIWLTHTFFAYYYFQKLTFVPRYSWLVFAWCMVLSVASGIILEAVTTLVTGGPAKLFIRRNCQQNR